MIALKKVHRKKLRKGNAAKKSTAPKVKLYKKPALATVSLEEAALVKLMTVIGFRSYLTAISDSGRKFESADDVMKHTAVFLGWCFKMLNGGANANGLAQSVQWTVSSMLAFAKDLMVVHTELFLRYGSYLEKGRHLKPASVVIYMRRARRFFVFVCSAHIDPRWRIAAAHLEVAKQAIGHIMWLHKRRINRSNWEDNDVRELVLRYLVCLACLPCFCLV
jgi:hypothetical protein